MPRLSMVPVFLREWLGERSFPREPEPALVMDDPEQVRAYDEAGSVNGVMAAAYLFHTAWISQVIAGCAHVLDLGCGPATQLLQVAQFNPATSFTGVDLSPAMLEQARARITAAKAGNVDLLQDDITRLASIDDASVDAVISTMALHHLPSFDPLRACFAQIARVAKPGAAIYLTDFGRLKSLRSVLYFAYQNALHQPHLFSLDYERSLRAAFLREDFQSVLQEFLPERAQLTATFKVPFLIVIKSGNRGLERSIRSELQKQRRALPAPYRRDLDDLRTFFRLGGLADDPFAAGPTGAG